MAPSDVIMRVFSTSNGLPTMEPRAPASDPAVNYQSRRKGQERVSRVRQGYEGSPLIWVGEVGLGWSVTLRTKLESGLRPMACLMGPYRPRRRDVYDASRIHAAPMPCVTEGECTESG